MSSDRFDALDTSVSFDNHSAGYTPPAPLVDSPRAGVGTGQNPIPSDAPAGTATVAIMTYNILAGGGPRLAAIESVIRDAGADLVGLQEVIRPDLLAALGERLGMQHAIAYAPSGWHIGVLSRWPIVETHAHAGPEMARALLEALIELPDGGRLRLFVTHLRAGFSDRRAGELRRLSELAFVLDHMRAARTSGEPHVLVGDFNSLAPGERFRATRVLRHALAVDAVRREQAVRLDGHPSVAYILPPLARPFRVALEAASGVAPLAWFCDVVAGLYMPRAVVRRTRAAGYVDCYAALHPDVRSRDFTCPEPKPAGRIDYVFASPALAPRLVSCEVLTETPTSPITSASDHRPVVARFRLGEWASSSPSTP
jgi:endonuclease/exonuclease/phosphatase family metal-dependent hydrolase